MNNIIHLIGRVTHELQVTEYPDTKRTRVKFSIAYSHRFWPARRINLAGESHSFWPPCRI